MVRRMTGGKYKSGRANPWIVIGLTLLLVAAMAICSLFGAVDFEWEEIKDSPIFWQLRVPRVVMSVLVGAVLSVCGAAYQSIFRNPLTDPYVLGVSSLWMKKFEDIALEAPSWYCGYEHFDNHSFNAFMASTYSSISTAMSSSPDSSGSGGGSSGGGSGGRRRWILVKKECS